MKRYSYAFRIACSVLLSCISTPTLTQAQPIEADTTLTPNNSIVKPQPGNVFEVVGGVETGSNLFHSFREFSVLNGSTAYFNNATSIQNIISRVTGGSVSNVDGLIQTNGTANLFLLNPNGIIFGPNAQLNIGGSFLSSTATSVVFADGSLFSATAPQTTPLLTISLPIGLQYRSNEGSIVNRSISGLQVQPGKTLALVGGDVQLNGGVLAAPGGSVELGGLAQSGTVGLKVDGNNLRLSFPDNIDLADVSLTNKAKVDVASFGGGNIAINARNLQISESEFNAGIKKGLSAVGSQAGDITINATGVVTVADGKILNNVESGAIGNAGNINIQAKSLFTDGGTLETRIFGKGNAGNILIHANDSVSFSVTTVRSNLDAQESEGNGGEVNIQARSLSLTNGAQLQVRSKGVGNAGSVTIAVRDTTRIDGEDSDGFPSAIFSNVNNGATGNGGNIHIDTGSLILSNGGQLEASTEGKGNAGNIFVGANNSVELSRNTPKNNTLITSSVREGAEGNGGKIEIQARALSLTGGAQVSASVIRQRNDLPGGRGTGGNILVDTSDSVNISGVGLNGFSSGIFANTETGAVGAAGNITINTPAFRISDGAIINAQTENSGSGGDIRINANTFEAINGGQLITNASSSGNAGSINVNGTEHITLSGTDPSFADRLTKFGTDIVGNSEAASGLFAQSSGAGVAGNLTVKTGQMTVSDGAKVSVSSPQGQAGNLNITANSLNLNGGSITAETGESGIAEGANISLQIKDLLRLENESKISATANGDAKGGNILIDPTFVLLFPSTGPNGSDIVAKADKGNGGNIRIDAQGIFGIAQRKSRAGNRSNDIDASSEFGSSGQVQLTSTVDPNQGVTQIPETVVDPNALVSQSPCKRGSQSQFTRTGRGGLPPNLSDDLSSEATQVGLVKPAPSIVAEAQKISSDTGPSENQMSKIENPIVPAQGWTFKDNGEVVLTAFNPTVTGPQRLKENPVGCPAP